MLNTLMNFFLLKKFWIKKDKIIIVEMGAKKTDVLHGKLRAKVLFSKKN
tara:strand:- start:131 stop:277 length:147 start_codon:yes stop_codon:yes gene_type:complete